MDEWIQSEINKLQNKYGDIPPPWGIFPEEHPYSICWRMGIGESHIMVWSAWWDEQNYNESERIAYFQKWKPSPCWLDWMIEAIWDINTFEDNLNLMPYFSRLEALGFGSKEDFERDLDDPKWLEDRY